VRTARLTRTIGIVLLLTLAATAAHAQTVGRNELAVFGGTSLLDASTFGPGDPRTLVTQPAVIGLIYPPPFGLYRSMGGSSELGVRYGRDLSSTLTITGDFSVAPGHELREDISYGCPEPLVCIAQPAIGLVIPGYSFTERITAYHYGGGLRLNVRPGVLTPSVIAGIGGVTFAGAHHRRSDLTVRVGGALTAAVRNLTTSLEIVDTIVADHYVTNAAEHDVHVRVGFGVRW
jgi:hypothetical protein